MKNRKSNKQTDSGLDCKAAGTLLFAYAGNTGELDSRSQALVEKHLSACQSCSKTAGDISATIRILLSIKTPDNTPTSLSLKRRRKILQSIEDKA